MKLANQTKRNPLKIVFLELKKYETTKVKEYNKKKWFEFLGNVEFTIEPDDLILQLENIINVKNWSKEKSMYDEKMKMEDMRYAELEYAREERKMRTRKRKKRRKKASTNSTNKSNSRSRIG